jgi:hypothetical protein
MDERTARCSCGALSIRAKGEPRRISACHATGASKTFVRIGDSGSPLEFHFCPQCGSTVFWRPAFRPGLVAIAYGCFETPLPGPSQAVYEEHRHPWVSIDIRDC